jgi:hypothetical protein
MLVMAAMPSSGGTGRQLGCKAAFRSLLDACCAATCVFRLQQAGAGRTLGT